MKDDIYFWNKRIEEIKSQNVKIAHLWRYPQHIADRKPRISTGLSSSNVFPANRKFIKILLENGFEFLNDEQKNITEHVKEWTYSSHIENRYIKVF